MEHWGPGHGQTCPIYHNRISHTEALLAWKGRAATQGREGPHYAEKPWQMLQNSLPKSSCSPCPQPRPGHLLGLVPSRAALSGSRNPICTTPLVPPGSNVAHQAHGASSWVSWKFRVGKGKCKLLILLMNGAKPIAWLSLLDSSSNLASTAGYQDRLQLLH